MNKPTFIVIGPGRAGTSWMYEILLEHPEVCMAAGTKETHFFNENYDKGAEWYFRFFKNCSKYKAVGEISNLYFYDNKVPERIHQLLPNVQLVTCLRDPLERMASVYLYRKRSLEVEGSFEEALDKQPDLLTNNYYSTLLNNYLKYFPKEKLTILFYENLKDDPASFVRQLYKAIQVDENYKPKNLYRIFNKSNKARLGLFSHIVHFGSNFLRRHQMYSLLTKLKRSKVLRGLIFSEINRRRDNVIPDHLKQELMGKLKGEIEGVESLTGKNLDEWKRVK